jgi:hypothetical protein
MGYVDKILSSPRNRSRPAVTIFCSIVGILYASTTTLVGKHLSGVRCLSGEQPISIGASLPFHQNIQLFQNRMDKKTAHFLLILIKNYKGTNVTTLGAQARCRSAPINKRINSLWPHSPTHTGLREISTLRNSALTISASI